jgi:hypothetical protein
MCIVASPRVSRVLWLQPLRLYPLECFGARYIICLGDSVTDIDAAQEVPYDEILSVGFMNSRPATAMTKYADTFDAVVLGNDGSLAPLAELVNLIDANGRARQARAP